MCDALSPDSLLLDSLLCPFACQTVLDYTIQEGAVEFGLLGDEGETGECASDAAGCSFSNPSSPYGITVLPLAPEEDGDAKADAEGHCMQGWSSVCFCLPFNEFIPCGRS